MPEQSQPVNSGLKDSVSKYMPQLDTLRAFAVIEVLISHWLRKHPKIGLFPFGDAGVNLFFVLSGFLITGILLKGRKKAEKENGSKIYTAKNFYIRRTLRIFPIYYIALFVFFIINFQLIRDVFLWYLFYSQNILYFVTALWRGPLSHLWSLAVEEQFYIVWPFVILFIPRKYLLKSIIGIILIGPVFRAMLFSIIGAGDRAEFINLLTPANIDFFGLGALLAYYRMNGIKHLDFNGWVSKAFVILNFLMIIMWAVFINNIQTITPEWINLGLLRQIFMGFNIAVTSLFLISKASIGFKGFLKFIFENKILLYIGKISYGIYLYHTSMPKIYQYLELPPINSLAINFIVMFCCVMIVSTISWFLIERPINNLKTRFAND